MQIEIQIPKAVLFDVKYTVEQATNFAKKEVALGFYMQKGVSVALCSQIAGMSEKEFLVGGGRGGHWYMPSTIPLSPDARSLWKSGASPVRWLPLPSRCHWQHGQAGWHCCKVPQSFEEVLHDAHRALSEAVRLRSGNVKIPPCLVHSLRPARPDAEVLSHSNGQELHGFVFSFDHLPFLLLCCL